MIRFDELIERKLRADEQDDSDSHTETDANTFHPSSLSRCPRQCTIQKLGLEDHGINTLWNFYLGTRQHTDLEEWFGGMFDGVEFEKSLTHEEEYNIPGSSIETVIKFTGHCDVYDGVGNAIYDFKTRKSWKRFNGASDAHKDQITTYMKMAGVEKAQLVYLVKSAPWDESEDIVKTWPRDFEENDWFEFDPERWESIKDRAATITEGLYEFEEEHGRLPETVEEVPFEPCGCWLCNSEDDE